MIGELNLELEAASFQFLVFDWCDINTEELHKPFKSIFYPNPLSGYSFLEFENAENKSSKVGMLELSSEAADAFAHLVCVTLLRGIGILYPFQCEGTIGWCWEAAG